MAFAATFVYLLVPGKRVALRVLITLFYFWAGSLKLNWEWISGAGLYRPMWPFSGVGVVIACAYVVVLELVVAWDCWRSARGSSGRRSPSSSCSTRCRGRSSGSSTRCSCSHPGDLPLSRAGAPADPPSGLLTALWTGRARRSAYGTAWDSRSCSWCLTRSRGLIRRSPARAGSTRCTCSTRVRSARGGPSCNNADGTTTRRDLKLRLDTRIACDPIVYFNRARNLCRQRDRGLLAFQDLDLHLSARRATDGQLRRVIATTGFCARRSATTPSATTPGS